MTSVDWNIADITPVVLELKSQKAPPAFDSLTRTAAALFDAPIVLISVIDEDCDRQVFASQIGLPAPWAKQAETPLSHSFCQHIKTSNAPLMVPDARVHPFLCENLAVRDLGVVAYLGAPIHDPQGDPLGAICIIDSVPRAWTERDQALLADLAKCISDEILLRAFALRERSMHQRLQVAHDRLRRYTALTEMVSQPALAPGLDLCTRLRELLRNMVGGFGYQTGHLAIVDPDDPSRAIIRARVGPDGVEVKNVSVSLDNTLAELALKTGHLLTRHASLPEDTRKDLVGAPVRDYTVVPLMGSKETPLGVVEMVGPTPRATRLDDNEETALGIASMFAAMLIEVGRITATEPAPPLAAAHLDVHAHLDVQPKKIALRAAELGVGSQNH